MKKVLLMTGVISMLVIGTGCTNNSPTDKQISTTTQSEVATTPATILSTAIEASSTDFSEIQTKLDQGKKIVEVESVPEFRLPPGIFKEQLWRLFKLDNIYFALYIRHNSNFFGGDLPNNSVQSGILWARKNDIKWSKFFVVKDKDEPDNDPQYFKPPDQNNILYLWTENKKMQIIAQDVHGGGSGEGVGKIISSVDGGKSWRIGRCFLMDIDMISVPSMNKKLTMPTRLQHFVYRQPGKSDNLFDNDFTFNSSTGKFEQIMFNKESNKNETIPMDDCQNILLP